MCGLGAGCWEGAGCVPPHPARAARAHLLRACAAGETAPVWAHALWTAGVALNLSQKEPSVGAGGPG